MEPVKPAKQENFLRRLVTNPHYRGSRQENFLYVREIFLSAATTPPAWGNFSRLFQGKTADFFSQYKMVLAGHSPIEQVFDRIIELNQLTN